MEIQFKNQSVIEYTNLKVLHRYMEENNLNLKTAKIHWIETLKFLDLCSDSNFGCVPSKVVDEVWHTFILHTKAYRDFCNEYLGKFIDHNPTSTKEVSFEKYKNTIELLNDRFGEINKEVWLTSSSLCDSGSDSGSGGDCDGSSCDSGSDGGSSCSSSNCSSSNCSSCSSE